MSSSAKQKSGCKIGVIGLGFMGATHLAAYRTAAAAGFANEIVAVCDRDPARRKGIASSAGNLGPGRGGERLFDAAEVAAYERPEELLADERVELVSVCTPTDSHVDLAIAALEAQKHVLVEKPVALTHAEVARLGAAARAAQARGQACMPGLCMRFWPAWSWLKRAAQSGAFGAVRSASFQRLAASPAWNRAFYLDPARAGGALADLHVHDADFVLHLFGPPDSVVSTGSLEHVTTLYRYRNGPAHVAAEGGWDQDSGFHFRMRYLVSFEGATADFELGREPELVLFQGGRAAAIELERWTGYEAEIQHLLAVIRGAAELAVTIADAEEHARLIDAERASLASGMPQVIAR